MLHYILNKIHPVIREEIYFIFNHLVDMNTAINKDTIQSNIQTSYLLGGKISELDSKAYSVLSAGAELPFFRPNYVDISTNILRFINSFIFFITMLDKALFEETKNTPDKVISIEDIFSHLKNVFNIYLNTWTYLNEDIRKAELEIQKAQEPIIELERKTTDLFAEVHSAKYPLQLIRIVDHLYSIELSIKKLIILKKI